MISSLSVKLRRSNSEDQSSTVSTIQRIYQDTDDIKFLTVDPVTKTATINKSAYTKLHRHSYNPPNSKYSSDAIKSRFESDRREKSVKPEVLPKPRHLVIATIVNKRENVQAEDKEDSEDDISVIDKSSQSMDSVDFMDKESSMDYKMKEPKRTKSFRKIFSGGFFSQKDRKKKDVVDNDNEANLDRQQQPTKEHERIAVTPRQEHCEEEVKEIEKQYAEMHVTRFNQIKQNFIESKTSEINLGHPKKRSIADFIDRPPVQKYIDSTSSSTSPDSERPIGGVRNTPPRAQETYHNFQPIKPNPYRSPPRTIERNLNRNDKFHPNDGPKVVVNDTYGTVFDFKSPKSPSLESTKLKLPPNRQIFEVQPRVKSPIPVNRVSTDKLIATELLKSTRSPTPPKRINSRLSSDEFVVAKPPMSPKIVQKPSEVVTDAILHSPTLRSPTPNELRNSASLKLSPQKPEIRKSVEEFCWKQLQKQKQEQDYNLYSMQMQMTNNRARSMSPNTTQRGARSFSLSGDVIAPNDVIYYQHCSIPEYDVLDRTVTNYPSFLRNQSDRRSENGFQQHQQRPIFRRGSLSKPEEFYYANQAYKKVTFPNTQQAWPTRNGYTQSPPQRRLDKQREIALEDDVFYPNASINGYGYHDGNYQIYQVPPRRTIDPRYPRRIQDGGARSPPEVIYMTRNQPNREQIYGRLPQAPLRYAEPIYGTQNKQVTVSDKFCDFYGQIHDPQSSGVLMGQLHNRPYSQHENFTRGTRLTSSANDMSRPTVYYREINDTKVPKHNEITNHDNRPLPPTPNDHRFRYDLKNKGPIVRRSQVSDTESGSDASEIQRINKSKSKKRGFFGK